jgi:hypothetical protein
MFNVIRGSLVAVLLAGASFAVSAPASAADVGVSVGGIGISVGNGHYYDAHHHRQAYSYPADWKSYHHPQSWYHSHSSWNDQTSHDYYRN